MSVILMVSWAEKHNEHQTATSQNNNDIFSFIPPPPEVFDLIDSITPIPDAEEISLKVFIPPSPDSERILSIFVPPSPDSEIISSIFVPASPDIPEIVSSEIEKFQQNLNTIRLEPVASIKIQKNQNIIAPEPIRSDNIQQNIQGFHRENSFVRAHYSFGTSEYYFTWFHNDKQYAYNEAYRFCHNLPGDWYVVSIESLQENQVISNIIEHYKLNYIWIGTVKQTGVYRFWDSGEKFVGLNFSQTGRFRRPQPDNAEFPEDCLAILDKFYPGDGVTWHDVACHHKKVTICERPLLR